MKQTIGNKLNKDITGIFKAADRLQQLVNRKKAQYETYISGYDIGTEKDIDTPYYEMVEAIGARKTKELRQ